MQHKALTKLHTLLNMDVEYGNRLIKIVGYDYDEERDRVFLHTENQRNHFDRPLDELYDFLMQLKPVQKKEVVPVQQSDLILSTAAGADKLKEILLDNIEKVQKDPNYIKQATAINNNVNSLINITKMQLDFAKAAIKLK